MLAIDPFYQVFDRLIQKDRKLREAIADYEIQLTDELVPDIRLSVKINCLGIVKIRIFKIAHALLRLGNFSRIILVHLSTEQSYFMATLIEARPEIKNPKRLEDCKMHQQTADAIRFRSWLDKELETRSAFLISTEGIYLECHIRKGVVSRIDPKKMEGKSLDEVLGIESAFRLLLSIKDAYERNEVLAIEYAIKFEDEARHYQGEIIPFLGTNSVMLLCKHVTPQPQQTHQ